MPCIFPCPSTIDLAWESEIGVLKTSVHSLALKPRSWLCVVCETYQPKQRDRHTSILHGFNNQTPWWPLTQELAENGITWPILDSTHLFQLLTLDFPSFPSYLKCGKGPLSAVLTCYPPGVEVHWQTGVKLELCGGQCCSLLSVGYYKCQSSHPEPSVRM